MITRILIVACLVFGCGFCLADELPENTREIKSLTPEQAAELVGKFKGQSLWLNYLIKIDKGVAQELAKFEGGQLGLSGLTSIDKDVAKELRKFKRESLHLRGLASINKDVAQKLAKFEGTLFLGLTSIDKDVGKKLGKFKGGSLWLSKLTSIDKGVAQELVNFRSKWADSDALSEASAHLRQAMKPLDELLSRSKSGVDWRAYLDWPALEAQAAAGQNLDVSVLHRLYYRFNANENGLEIYQFVTVRRSLAAALDQAYRYKNKNEGILNLSGLTSIDEVSLACLRSNTTILLPKKYSDKKD